MPEEISLCPIGYVHAQEGERLSRIELAAEFAPGLAGVETLEHLWVLYWMHQLSPEDRRLLLAHPRGDRTRPKQGVFSLHSPMRPNPIGLTRVKLVELRGNCLLVEGLDARDGSPVLDLKSG